MSLKLFIDLRCGGITHPAQTHVVAALLQIQGLQELLHSLSKGTHLHKHTHTHTLSLFNCWIEWELQLRPQQFSSPQFSSVVPSCHPELMAQRSLSSSLTPIPD